MLSNKQTVTFDNHMLFAAGQDQVFFEAFRPREAQVTKDRIAYLYQRAEIDSKAALKMKRTAALFSSRQTWYPSHHEPGKQPLEMPPRKRVARTVVINTNRFLMEDGLLEIYVPGFGANEQGDSQPVAQLEFEDGELKLSWVTESGGYEDATIPRNKHQKTRAAKASRPVSTSSA
jgi:hypothetical protein